MYSTEVGNYGSTIALGQGDPSGNLIDTPLKVCGVSYMWNHAHQHGIGFLADEMAEVLPEISGFDEAGKPIGIDYGRVTAQIVGASMAQQRQIEDPLRRVEALEAMDRAALS